MGLILPQSVGIWPNHGDSWVNPYQTSDKALVSMFDGLVNAKGGRFVASSTKAYDCITDEYFDVTGTFSYAGNAMVCDHSYLDLSSGSDCFSRYTDALLSGSFTVVDVRRPITASYSDGGVCFPFNVLDTIDGTAYFQTQQNIVNNYIYATYNAITEMFSRVETGCVDAIIVLTFNSLLSQYTTYKGNGDLFGSGSVLFPSVISSMPNASIRLFNLDGQSWINSCNIKHYAIRLYNRALSSNEITDMVAKDVSRFNLT